MMVRGLLVLMLLSAGSAPAAMSWKQDLFDKMLKELMRANGAAAIGRIEKQFAGLQAYQMRCRMEEERRQVPVGCYQYLNLLPPSDQAPSELARLDGLCERAVAAQDSVTRLEEIDGERAVSAACRQQVSRRLERLRYQNADTGL